MSLNELEPTEFIQGVQTDGLYNMRMPYKHVNDIHNVLYLVDSTFNVLIRVNDCVLYTCPVEKRERLWKLLFLVAARKHLNQTKDTPSWAWKFLKYNIEGRTFAEYFEECKKVAINLL